MTKKSIIFSLLQRNAWKICLLALGLTNVAAAEVKPIKEDVKSLKVLSDSTYVHTKNNELYRWTTSTGPSAKEISPTLFFSNVLEYGVYEYRKNSVISEIGYIITEDHDLYRWGYNAYGVVGNGTVNNVATPTKILSDVTSSHSGNNVSCAIKTDGELYCWGDVNGNATGRYGPDKKKLTLYPKKYLDNVKKVFLSSYYNCALTNDDDLYCWGRNDYGTAGDGTGKAVSTPTKILSDVKSFVGGYDHNCAVTNNGELYCWGNNSRGEVGTGNTGDRVLTPTKILDNVDGIQMDGASCAIKNNGDLYCWGDIPNNENEIVPSPVKILNNVKSLFQGNNNIYCAIKTNNDLYCWGKFKPGQIGNPSKEDYSSPTKILDNVYSVSDYCAIKNNGELFCWGKMIFNAFAGEGEALTPIKISDEVSKVIIDSGMLCITKTDGSAQCWGNVTEEEEEVIKSSGKIANLFVGTDYLCVKTIEDSLSCSFRTSSQSEYLNNILEPKLISKDISNITSSASNKCTIKDNGDLYCWGYNFYGQVGNGNTKIAASPVKVLSNVVKIALDEGLFASTCAIQDNGDLYCWGSNFHSSVGTGHENNDVLPQKILSNVVDVYKENGTTCAIKENGDLYCWGYTPVGNGTNTDAPTPEKILDNVRTVVHGCAIKNNNDLYCWGSNNYGYVGTGDTQGVRSPVKVLSNVAEVSKVNYATCAIKTNKDLYCWGKNPADTSGGTPNPSPRIVLNNVIQLAHTEYHICAVTSDNDLYCWGSSPVGDGSTEKARDPQFILANVSKVDVGHSETCALTKDHDLYCFGQSPTKLLGDVSDMTLSYSINGESGCAIKLNGELYCWGNNSNGQVGNNSTVKVTTPVKVLDNVNKVQLVNQTTCAITNDNYLYCWGDNSSSKLGIGNPYVNLFIGSNQDLNPKEECSGHWNYSRVGYSCDNGELGACLNSGEFGCYAPNVICTAAKGTPQAEKCDGIDNDCDGQIDEDYALLGKVCYVENGNCKAEGVYICNANGTGTECSAKATDECISDGDVNKNGIPDLYEKTDDTADKIVRPNTKLAQSYVVKGKKKATLYFEWFSAASFNKIEKVNEKKVPFKYYVRIKVKNIRTGKLVSTSFKTTKTNKFTIRCNKLNKRYKFTVDYRVIIKKGPKKKKTSWSPKLKF